MKRTLLYLSVFASSFFGFKAAAQTTVQLYDNAVFYSMYEGVVSQPLPAGAQRNSNSSYGVKLTDDQIASFGSSLTLNIHAASLCDDYDRIGNVNLAFVPKGATSYTYGDVDRIEIGRFITPFMVPDGTTEVPYTFDVSNLLDLFHDSDLASTYDFWVEFEIYGYQGSPTQGGAVADYPSVCTGRNDVYRGSLEFVTNGTYTPKDTYFKKLSFKYELKDYTLAGTDVLGQTVKSIGFNVDADITNAKYYFINSNHGSGTNGEEYVRRTHNIYLDGALKLTYMPGGVSCVPYRVYNTQPNCIYINCATGLYRANTAAAWSWNNWCPGNAVPIRVIDLGNLAAGDHTYKIEVPDAVFYNNDGYFPMSVYVMGTYATSSTKSFTKNNVSLTPNPVADVATINTNGDDVKAFAVYNTLGQEVLKGTGNNINMSQLQTGVYVVKTELVSGQTVSNKIMKK